MQIDSRIGPCLEHAIESTDLPAASGYDSGAA